MSRLYSNRNVGKINFLWTSCLQSESSFHDYRSNWELSTRLYMVHMYLIPMAGSTLGPTAHTYERTHVPPWVVWALALSQLRLVQGLAQSASTEDCNKNRHTQVHYDNSHNNTMYTWLSYIHVYACRLVYPRVVTKEWQGSSQGNNCSLSSREKHWPSWLSTLTVPRGISLLFWSTHNSMCAIITMLVHGYPYTRLN